MPLARDVEVELHFTASDSGGRQSPVYSGYRPQFFYEGRDWDAVHEYPDVPYVSPGDSVRAYLAFASPDAHVGRVSAGMMFQCREGARVVATGQVLRVLDLEESARRALNGEPPRLSGAR